MALGIAFASNALATNGAFDYGYSEITRGMGGAGSALPQDTLIAAINPAGMVWVKHAADLGAVLYFPTMYYDASVATPNAVSQIVISPGRHISNKSPFFLPDFGMNMMLNDKSSLGISFYSVGGYGSSYPGWGTTRITVAVPFAPFFLAVPQNGPFGGGYLASDLKQALGSLTYAHKLGATSSVGLSMLLGVQTLSLKGANLLTVFSNSPSAMTDRGTDFSVGIGARAGVLLGFIPHVKLSASYQPKVIMSKFQKYRGLFPNRGEFDLPSNGVVGVAFELPRHIIFAFDVQKIWFTEIKAYGNKNNAILPGGSCQALTEGPTCFGGKNGVGFGWRDSVAYKVGVQWQARPGLQFRAGFSHARSVFTASHLAENVIAPGGAIENIITAGVSKKIGKHGQINGVFVYVPHQEFNGINAFSTTANQTVVIHARGFGGGISYSWLL